MNSFAETGLCDGVLNAVAELGFTQPTPIQIKTIPVLLSGKKDLIALAQTGTGKTAAYGLPIIDQTDSDSTDTQAIILSPTRELCIQITNDMKSYAKYMDNINITPVYGGASIDTQIRSLKKGSQIVVGTPGRVLDLIDRKKLELANIRTLVLDEADEMLSRGFKEDLDSILAGTPNDKQVLLFSATMSPEIKSITKKYMKKPDEIIIGKQNAGCENVEHKYYLVHAKDKYEALKRIADMNPDIYGIVFCRTKIETKEIADKLIQDGYNADALHGDLSQVQRDLVMNRFRVKHLQLLIATDVAARGLDVTELSHIINYDLPDEIGLYVHRSGRTGRAGNSGISISIINMKEKFKIRILEEKIGKKFERAMVPEGKDVLVKRMYDYVDKVEKAEIDEKMIAQFMPAIYEKLSGMDSEQIIKHFISVELNKFLEYYKNASNLNASLASERENGRGRNGKNSRDNYDSFDRNDRFNRNDRYDKNDRSDRNDRYDKSDRSAKSGRGDRGRQSRTSFSLFGINLGSKNKVTPQRIIGMINDRLNSNTVEIGKIEIFDKHSLVEIDSRFEQDVNIAFLKASKKDKGVILELMDYSLDQRKESGRRKRS